MSKKITRLFLNPNEMIFRKVYWALLKDEKITTVFLPITRQTKEEKKYREGQNVVVRIIDSIGADWSGIPPEFYSKDLSKIIHIERVYTKPLGKLCEDDFIGSSPDIYDRTSLKYHFGVLYNLFYEDFNSESLVTVINFSYLHYYSTQNSVSNQTLEDLVDQGILTSAKKPQDNNHNYSQAPRYTISFVAEDYPARTPIMWNTVYRTFKINAVHNMFVASPTNLPKILEVLRNDEKYLGGGFGVGFKDEGIAFLDELDSIASKIGAVNFVLKDKNNKLVGFNVDGIGYAKSMEELFSRHSENCVNKKVVLIGSGGTASAIAFAIAKLGMKIVILNRTIKKAEMLAERINIYFYLSGDNIVCFGGESEIVDEIKSADVIINVSIKGSSGELEQFMPLASAILPVSQEQIIQNHKITRELFSLIKSNTIISDVVLRENDTPFISLAKELGFKTLDGIPMVVNQGVEAMWLVHRKEFEDKKISKNDVFNVIHNAVGF